MITKSASPSPLPRRSPPGDRPLSCPPCHGRNRSALVRSARLQRQGGPHPARTPHTRTPSGPATPREQQLCGPARPVPRALAPGTRDSAPAAAPTSCGRNSECRAPPRHEPRVWEPPAESPNLRLRPSYPLRPTHAASRPLTRALCPGSRPESLRRRRCTRTSPPPRRRPTTDPNCSRRDLPSPAPDTTTVASACS